MMSVLNLGGRFCLLALSVMMVVMVPLKLSATDTDAAPVSHWYDHAVACFSDKEGFQARFTHEFISRLNVKSAPRKGRVLVSRSGRFKLEYAAPYEKTIVYDGKKLQAWDGTSRALVDGDESAEILFSNLIDLFGKPLASLEERFRIRLLGAGSAVSSPVGTQVLELVPRIGDSLVYKIVMTVGTCPPIQRLIVVDRAGNMIRLTFHEIEMIVNFGKGDFRFRVPEKSSISHP